MTKNISEKEIGNIKEYKTIKRFLEKFPNYNTRTSYLSFIRKYFAFIDGNPDEYIKDIRLMENGEKIKVLDGYEDDITAFWSHLIQKNTPPSSVTTIIVVIRVFFTHNRIKFDDEFWNGLRRRGNGSQPLTIDTPVTNEMLEKILTYGSLKARALFLAMASSGMRLGETLQLVPSDIDFKSKPTKITIRPEITKNKKRRITFISDEATRFLKEWLEIRDDYLKSACKRSRYQRSMV